MSPRQKGKGRVIWEAMLVGVVTVGLLAGVRARSSSTSEDAGTPSQLSMTTPLPHGVRTSLAQALASMKYHVLLPDDQQANVANLAAVWVNPATQQVALVYKTAGVTIMMWQANYTSAKKEYQTYVLENRVKARVGHLSGGPVLVIEPRTDVPRTSPAWIEFEETGLDVNIFSYSHSTGELLRIAQSMR